MRSISWKYSRRMRLRGSSSSCRHQPVDALAQIPEDEILLGGGLAFVDLLRPLLDRQLDAERLVDPEGDVEEIEAVDAEVIHGVTLGLDVCTWDVAGLGNDRGDGVERRSHLQPLLA